MIISMKLTITDVAEQKPMVIFQVSSLSCSTSWRSYSRLSLSRIPRDSLKYFEISVVRHIRFAELRNKLIQLTTFNKYMCNWTLKFRYKLKNIVEKRRNCSLGAISPLFHNIFLHVVRFTCLGGDQIFTSR